MSRRFGPSRGELIFRAIFSAFGLGLMALALALRGLPEGPGLIEVVGLAGVMFGGSLVHAGWKLWNRDHP